MTEPGTGAAIAAELKIGSGAATLLSGSTEPQSTGRPDGQHDCFEGGQLSGPNGPKFVGFGAPVLRPLWRDLVENAAFGLGVGIAIFGLTMLKPLLI